MPRPQKYTDPEIMAGRDPKLSGIARLAEAHGWSIDQMLELSPRVEGAPQEIRVAGEVAAGLWMDVSELESDIGKSPLPPDPRYPIASQFDLVVRGNSINNVARDGERLRCVDINKSGVEIFDDDLVIFQRTKDNGQLIETTAKRFRRRGGFIELWPDSDDPRWQEPVRIDARKAKEGEEGDIIALVLYAYRPVPRPSRR